MFPIDRHAEKLDATGKSFFRLADRFEYFCISLRLFCSYVQLLGFESTKIYYSLSGLFVSDLV